VVIVIHASEARVISSGKDASRDILDSRLKLSERKEAEKRKAET
jgi:hypothetical protein